MINPGDAAPRGIASGDRVRVFNDRGAFEATAELSGDAMTGVVVAPMGYWPRDAKERRTVNAITPPAFADYGHAPTFSDVLVEVAKVA
jgi:anaerobic selenocysteine-containing dehydrogenase